MSTPPLPQHTLDAMIDNDDGPENVIGWRGEPTEARLGWAVWTHTHVYYPEEYDGVFYCGSIERDPPGVVVRLARGLATEVADLAERMSSLPPEDPARERGTVINDCLAFPPLRGPATFKGTLRDVDALLDALDFIADPNGLQSVAVSTKKAAARLADRLRGRNDPPRDR